MKNANKGKGGKHLNNFREWLSDNLRYIVLILGIVIILLGIFFGVRAISSSLSGSENSESVFSDSVVSEVAAEDTSSAVSVTEAQEAELDPTTAEVTESTDEALISLVTAYYEGYTNSDADAVAALVDTLSEEARAAITSEADHTDYSDVKVYTTPSPESAGTIVYATYNYREAGQIVNFPGIAQLYVENDGTESRIILGDLSAEVAAYITTLRDQNATVSSMYALVDTNFATAAAAESAAQAAVEAARSEAETAAAESAAAQAEAEAQAAAESAAAEAEAQAAAESEAAAAESETAAAETSSSSDTYTANATVNQACNLRSAPEYADNIIAELAEGERVQRLEFDDGWVLIRRSNGTTGYMASKFLS